MALCRLECPICQQSLLNTPSGDEANPDEDEDSWLNIVRSEDGHGETRHRRPSWSWAPVATSCGHLFHKCCLMEWFRSRRNYEGSSRLRGSCPSCRKLIATYGLVRVYLTPSSEPLPVSEGSAASTSNTSHISLLLPRSDHSSDASSSPMSSLYSDFFNLGIERRSRSDILRLRRRLRPSSLVENDFRNLDSDCENPDCMELRSAVTILKRECKTLQRRLNLEIDVSKMKSILVASQQRDINELKTKKGSTASTWMFTLGFGIMLSIWLTVSLCLIVSVVSRYGGTLGLQD